MEIGPIRSNRRSDRAVSEHLQRGSVHIQEPNKENSREPALSKLDLEELIQGVNKFLLPARTHLNFVLHEKLDTYYVQVINNRTDEVIREIPPKKFLDMYARMAEMLGLIVDERI